MVASWHYFGAIVTGSKGSDSAFWYLQLKVIIAYASGVQPVFLETQCLFAHFLVSLCYISI